MNRNTLWIVLLLASVLANGVLAGVLIQRTGGPDAPISAAPESFNPAGRFHPRDFLSALPKERQGEAREALRAGLREAAPLRRAARRARRNAIRLLAAEPFDPEAAARALADTRAARAAVDAHAEAVILSIVADLPEAERRAALRAAWSGRPPRGSAAR